MMSLEQQIAALRGMPPAELRAAWRSVYRKAPPDLSPELLARGIAYRLQERQHGGLRPAVRREIARLARRVERTGSADSLRDIRLKTGTRLVRSWNGKTLSVLVGGEGFEFDGRQYGSLSQIARTVTGANWSGPRFFGLKSRRCPPSRAGRQ